MITSLVLADIGGTHVRLRAVGSDGETVTELQAIRSGVEDENLRAAMDELGAVLQQSKITFKRFPGGLHLIVASRAFEVPHAARDHTLRDSLKQIAVIVQPTRVTLVPDGVASYVGCLGGKPGVVVTVGTGTIAIAVDELSQVHKMDGLGPQLGDVGSGYWVGLRGLISACRWVDRRRGGSQLLKEAAARAFGNVEDLPNILRPSHQVRSVARFAEPVVAAARLGDVAAGQILDEAARDLCELVIDAAALVSGGTGLAIVVTGGFVAAVPELASRIEKWFADNSRYAPLVAPHISALDGCYEIGAHGVPEVFTTWIEELNCQ